MAAIGVAVGLTAAAFAVSLLGGIAFVLPILLFGLDVQSLAVFLLLSAVGQLGFLAVGYAYTRRRAIDIPIAVPSARETGYAAGGIVTALTTATVLSVVLALLDLVPESALGETVEADPSILLGLIVLSVVLVAPAEEFLFRGVIQGRLRQSFGPVGAVTGASLLFGSLHLGNYTGALGAVVGGALLIAVTGSVFGVLYERTQNLAVPIVTHAGYNVTLLVVSYLTL